MVTTARARAANEDAATSSLFSDQPTTEILRSTNTSELVVALCGPIGSPLHEVATTISNALTGAYGYDSCTVIRLSEFIKSHADKVGGDHVIPAGPKAKRVEALIDAGDKMRDQFGASVLADLAVSEIRLDQEKNGRMKEGDQFVSRRVCHIIDSIKNQAELDLLREVYREVLYVVGVFSPVSARERKMTSDGFESEKIHFLMEKDAAGDAPHGQTVGDTFPQSDFFLRMETSSTADLSLRVNRFLDLVLGTKIITPTNDESAMYAAASAASGSACLSRQVGAAVTDKSGAVLAVGWNDVPKPFGGLYSTDHEGDPMGRKDLRCYNKGGGKCFNDEEKDLLAESLIESLGTDIIPASKQVQAKARLTDNRKVKGLIEFSRAIHAEMHAILNALRVGGDRVSGGSIFVTTYPCHACARHIIAAGISNVYYIEPYKKSLATKLHDDAITEDESDDKFVRLLPYEGVAPTRYLSFFKMLPNSRKSMGKLIQITSKNARPRAEKSLQSMPELESMVVRSLVARGILPDVAPVTSGMGDGPKAA